MKRYPRTFLRTLVTGLWLLALLLVAEMAIQLFDLWQRERNAFLQAEQENTLFPGRVARLEQQRPLTTDRVPPRSTWPALTDTGAWPLPLRYVPNEPPAHTEERRRDFAQLNEEQRQTAAFLHSEMVLQLVGDKEQGLMPAGLYGAYSVEVVRETSIVAIPAGVDHAAYRALDSGRTTGGPAPCRPELGGVPAEYLRGASGDVYAFMNLLEEAYLRLLLRPYEAPPDSPWEIPFVRYKPNQSNLPALGAQFSTNNFGLRDDPIAVPKPPGRLRILCLGGSTTEEGPTNAATYPNILERALQARFPDRDLEVINGGVSGMTLFSHHLRLPDYLTMQPDLVVFYIGINDVVQKYLVRDRALPTLPLAHSELIRRVAPGLLFPADLRGALGQEVMHHYEALCRAFLSNYVPVFVCTFAYPYPPALDAEERVYYDYNARTWPPKPYSLAMHVRAMQAFNENLKHLAKDLDLPLVPVAELMRGGSEYFGDICHMRDEGVARKAAIIEAYLAPMLEERLSAKPW